MSEGEGERKRERESGRGMERERGRKREVLKEYWMVAGINSIYPIHLESGEHLMPIASVR